MPTYVSRSVGELRTWVTELTSAGVPVSDGENKKSSSFFGMGGDVGRGQGFITPGDRGRDIAHDRRERQQDDTFLKTDLEGGSRGTLEGRVPVLVVGNKEDVGESMRGAGSTLASELGAGHVSVVRGRECFFLSDVW